MRRSWNFESFRLFSLVLSHECQETDKSDTWTLEQPESEDSILRLLYFIVENLARRK